MKVSRTRIALLVLIWIVTSFPAFANETFCVNGFIYKALKDSSSLALTGYQTFHDADYSQPLHIPATVMYKGKAYSVKRIESEAFKGQTEIQSIIVEEGIEMIGENVFEHCTNLKSVYIPASVESIKEGLFGSCYNLTSVVVATNNEIYDSRDASNAIIDSDTDELLVACSSTQIPPSVKSIGDFAFYHCITMEELVVPEGVERIGNFAFFGCSSLKKICLPKSLTELGADAFQGCNSLVSINIPENVVKIEEGNIFAGCNNLTSVQVDDANPNYDSRSNCNGIVRKSDSALIATCRTTQISSDISILGDYCFDGTIIHSVRIPESVVNVSTNAFSGCNEIDEIIVSPNNPKYISPKGSNALLTKDGKTLLLGCRTTAIPYRVEKIEYNAFMGRYSKLVLRMPETIKEISPFAFSHCNVLYEVIIPQSVQSIGPYAFEGCTNLVAVQIPSSVKKIDISTFSNCYNLSTVSLTEGLEEIARHAFLNCKSLKHIYLPASVTKVDDFAFEDSPFAEK